MNMIKKIKGECGLYGACETRAEYEMSDLKSKVKRLEDEVSDLVRILEHHDLLSFKNSAGCMISTIFFGDKDEMTKIYKPKENVEKHRITEAVDYLLKQQGKTLVKCDKKFCVTDIKDEDCGSNA